MGDAYKLLRGKYELDQYNIFGGIYSDLNEARKAAKRQAEDYKTNVDRNGYIQVSIRKYNDIDGVFHFFGCVEYEVAMGG
jgi:hypothetical protein